jgi:hypothetical protein
LEDQMTDRNRWTNRFATHLIRIALVATFALSAVGSAAASPSDDGVGAYVTGGKATPILFGT